MPYFKNDFGKYSITTDTIKWSPTPEWELIDPQLKEISGIAPSFANGDSAYWTHEDSGSDARLLLYSVSGKQLGKYFFKGAGVRDLEDITLLKNDDGSANIYVGDIGDNNKARASVKIFILPDVKLEQAETDAASVRVLELVYPLKDGLQKKENCEAMFVDPATKDIFLVAKNALQARVFKVDYPYNESGVDTLKSIGELVITGQKVTAASISVDGKQVIVKTLDRLYYWERHENELIDSLFTREPVKLPYKAEVQGEAVCFSLNGESYLTISETGQNVPVKLYKYTKKLSW